MGREVPNSSSPEGVHDPGRVMATTGLLVWRVGQSTNAVVTTEASHHAAWGPRLQNLRRPGTQTCLPELPGAAGG